MTSFSCVKESSRGAVHYINGVLLNLEGTRLEVVVTDGHHLVLLQHRVVGSFKAKRTRRIPGRVANNLEHLLPDDASLAVRAYERRERVFIEIAQYATGSGSCSSILRS